MYVYFYDPSLKTVDKNANELKLEFIDFGGQGQIYKWEYSKKAYVMKVILGDDSVLRRLRDIREIIEKTAGSFLPSCLRERGFPIGQGTADPEEFSFDKNDKVFIVVYNWVDGVKLKKFLEKEPVMSNKRKLVAKQILEILTFLEQNGVVHNDLYPDNFIIDASGRLYIIDLEGAGLFNPGRNTWIWRPEALGKSYPGYCDPPESLSNLNDSSIFGERWIGTTLIFECLFGMTPFQFLSRIDAPALLELYKKSDKENIAWPPYGSEMIESHYLNPKINVDTFRKEIRNACSLRVGRSSPLEKLAFLTFIYGFEQPARRPTFSIIKDLILKDVLETWAR